MKRIDRIYNYIRDRSLSYGKETLQGRIGVAAAEIAEKLAILRNNVSMELNALHRQNKIIKIIGRPVLYFDKSVLEELTGDALLTGPYQCSVIEECFSESNEETRGAFSRLIGADSSLKKQVEQAKAAILYPPDGLHTLIVGQTGVGKTLFAHMMYEYGRDVHKLAVTAPFITFNCADYYNNSQLLISHIFGHVKGAFTGADVAKRGLVEEADQGILFLDEIHRLPPEGQEMIFYFIDTGTFNRLGETTRSRRAKVLIIGATTEDPASALTRTFVRRIPNIITIRPLIERSISEKIEIIKLLLADEVQRINKPVKISLEAIKALLGSIGSGNVGQLKSNIKLLCAKAFLNCLDNPNYIEIDFRILPTNIRNGLLTFSADRRQSAELAQYISEPLLITPSGKQQLLEEEVDKEPFNLYQVVEDKVDLLKGEGISDGLIKQIVAADVNVYIKSFYNKQNVHMSVRERLLKIVDKRLVDFTEEISLFVQNRLNRVYSERFLYAFSLHLSAFLKRLKENETISYSEIEGAIPRDSLEFKVAVEIKEKIESYYNVEVPKEEMEYFALLLESIGDDEHEEKVVIVVATHGKSAATSMVEVAQKLFSTNDNNIMAIDMPLEVEPQAILEKMITRLSEINHQKGILLLADMGSLCNFGVMLMERLSVPVKTIDMVSTPLILEAMRKADIVGIDLNAIYDSLVNFKGYEVNPNGNDIDLSVKREALVTICTSGAGAAVKLKEMVEEILGRVVDRPIAVIPMGIKKMEVALQRLADDYKIIATVGMVKPKFAAPFISLEKLINGEGEIVLQKLLHNNNTVAKHKKDIVVKNLCEESLQKFLTYLNPAKVISVLLEFDSVLEKSLAKPLSNPLRIRLIVHCGCALERMVLREGLVYRDNKAKLNKRKLQSLRDASIVFKKTLNIEITDDELCYIAEMI